MKQREYKLSFRTYFPSGNKCDHVQKMKLSEIGKWIEAYIFTHPECESITVKVWPKDEF